MGVLSALGLPPVAQAAYQTPLPHEQFKKAGTTPLPAAHVVQTGWLPSLLHHPRSGDTKQKLEEGKGAQRT